MADHTHAPHIMPIGFLSGDATSPGRAGVRAHAAAALASSVLALSACADLPTGVVDPGPDPDPVVVPGVPVRIDIPTYDGSGQAVHPDVVVFDEPWHGATHWMAVTPYPNGNAGFENPSIIASDDGLHWRVPDGVTNPIVRAPAGGYNSDPDLLYDAARDRLVLVWREVTSDNTIKAVESKDGRTWSAPVVLTKAPNHQILSPALVIDGARPMLWYVDSGTMGCAAQQSVVRMRSASDASALLPATPDAGWSPAVATSLSIPGHVPWHLDVAPMRSRGELWAVVHAYRAGSSCGTGDLYLARSRDGVSWTTDAEPFLRAAGREWSEASLYRTSLVPDEERGVLRLWLSARSKRGAWSLGYVELTLADGAP